MACKNLIHDYNIIKILYNYYLCSYCQLLLLLLLLLFIKLTINGNGKTTRFSSTGERNAI